MTLFDEGGIFTFDSFSSLLTTVLPLSPPVQIFDIPVRGEVVPELWEIIIVLPLEVFTDDVTFSA